MCRVDYDLELLPQFQVAEDDLAEITRVEMRGPLLRLLAVTPYPGCLGQSMQRLYCKVST